MLDHFPEHNTAYIVMEFLEGRTLKEVVAQTGAHPDADHAGAAGACTPGYGGYAPCGRDPSRYQPGHLMELKDGTVKLMDFGCARDFQSGLTETIP